MIDIRAQMLLGRTREDMMRASPKYQKERELERAAAAEARRATPEAKASGNRKARGRPTTA